jgi:death on curing protein
MMRNAKPLTIQDVKRLAHRLARKFMAWNEKIPDFGTRYPNILESCLMTPFQTFDKKDLYPTLHRKSAILFYLMIKNHPFQNGNKRTAVTALLVFLFNNGQWLKVPKEKLYKFAVWVAESDPDLKDGVLVAIEDFVRKNIYPVK